MKLIGLTRKLARKRTKMEAEVKFQEKKQGDNWRTQKQNQIRAKQEAEEEAKKKKFSAASKIPRVKKGKKEKNRIYKKPMQKEEKPVAIDPEILARRKYLGEYEEEEAANNAAKSAAAAH